MSRVCCWREALHDYPRAVLRKRLAEETFRVWHHGEYNFVQRMARRRDPVAVAVCLGEFLTGVMRIVLLLDRDYAPWAESHVVVDTAGLTPDEAITIVERHMDA